MTMADPFARSVEAIDQELAAHVAKREAGVVEILHGCFAVERAALVIDRLIEERLRASKRGADGMPTPAPMSG